MTGVRGTQELPARSCEAHAFQLGTKLIPEKRFTTPRPDQGMHWAPRGKQGARRTMLGPEGAYGQVGEADFNQRITQACEEGHAGKAEAVMKGCNGGSQKTTLRKQCLSQN